MLGRGAELREFISSTSWGGLGGYREPREPTLKEVADRDVCRWSHIMIIFPMTIYISEPSSVADSSQTP